MALRLSTLARACAARPRRILAAWLLLLVMVGGTALITRGEFSNDLTIPNTESFAALSRLSEEFPGAEGASARVVFVAPTGDRVDAPALKGAIGKAVTALADAPHVVAATDPFATRAVSADGRTAYTNVQYDLSADEVTAKDRQLVADVAAAARQAGLEVEKGGTALATPIQVGGTTEALGLAVAVVVLLVTFRSTRAAMLPLVTAAMGVGIGLAALLSLSGIIAMTSSAPTLGLMIGLAVGIDYALFIVSRHRGQLAEGMAVDESVARAVGTAGGAVLFAGLTVVMALASLAVVRIPFLTVMGLAAAGTVVIAVAVALTALPALLALGGERLRPRASARAATAGHRAGPVPGPRPASLGGRWVRFVTARPAVTIVVGILVLVVLALPVGSLHLGLPGDESASTKTTERRAYDLVSTAFGAGVNGPLLVLVEEKGSGADVQEAAARFAKRVADLPHAAAVLPGVPSQDGSTVLLTVISDAGPADADTEDLVQDIRGLASEAQQTDLVRVAVTGQTAINIDISTKLADALPAFLMVVVLLALVLLTVVFHSVVVAVTAIAGFLLTISATGGAVVAVFQWGWLAGPLQVDDVGPVLNFLPVLLVGILFGLAMDYQVFLVSRMREEHTRGVPARAAVLSGFEHGARVVTAAALIMIAVFLGFFFGHDPFVKAIGFALAVGVLVDAFAVRMILVPAVMALLGERAWSMPRWLDRITPHVDIEGAGLPASPPPPAGHAPAGATAGIKGVRPTAEGDRPALRG